MILTIYNIVRLIGKEFEYHFVIDDIEEECYHSCLTCYSKSNDDENHQCKICKQGYYFIEDTYNCYKEISEHYYFDENNQIFSPCYADCLTCNDKEINSTYMNCLSCENDYNYYSKSNNCLKCPKYVNYLQTKCIDTIPDGYYLSDKKIGTIEKCHELCKTCQSGPFFFDNQLYMNCESCLYENKEVKLTKGNCPEYPGKQTDDNKGSEGNKKSEEENSSSSNSAIIWVIIIIVILIIIVSGVIIYKKCFGNKDRTQKSQNDYYNIEGKSIPFEDETNNIN